MVAWDLTALELFSGRQYYFISVLVGRLPSRKELRSYTVCAGHGYASGAFIFHRVVIVDRALFTVFGQEYPGVILF